MRISRLAFMMAACATTALLACGDEASDPAGGADTGVNTDTGGGDQDAAGSDAGDDVAVGADAGEDTGGEDAGGDTGTGDDTAVPDASPTDAGGGEDTTGDDTGAPFVCGESVTFTGQVFGEDVPNGGVPVIVTSPDQIVYPDGGLSAVRAAFPASGDAVTVDITVTEATVIATNFFTDAFEVPPSQSTFWLADSSGAVEVRLDFNDIANVPEFDVRVGHRISFRATSLGQYNGKGQIAAATDFQLLGTDGDVYIVDVTGQDPPLALVDNLVRVTGTMIENTGACGGDSECWRLQHGDKEIELRTESQFYSVGECMTFVGPMGAFRDTPQLNETNFDWTRDYGNVD